MWSRLDDRLIDHEKIFAAGDLITKNGNGPVMALGFYTLCLMWSNKHLTDGVISAATMKGFHHAKHPLKLARVLEHVGLLEQVEGGWQIHDFHDYNPTAAAVKQRQKDRHLNRR